MTPKEKYEVPMACDLTGTVHHSAHAQACKYGGTPTQTTCQLGSIATARCKTGTMAGGQCTNGGTATFTCRKGSSPNL